MKIETGDLTTPDGTPYKGFKITVGGSPIEAERTYQDIDAIFKANPDKYRVKEERFPDGKFKSFTVET